MGSFCEYGDEPSGYIRGGNLTKGSIVILSRRIFCGFV
jgi:hypothetical protein